MGNFHSGDSGSIQHPPTPPLGQMSNGKAGKYPCIWACVCLTMWLKQDQQHWLAGLHSIDPSISAGPGTSSVTTTATQPHAWHITHLWLFLSQRMSSLLSPAGLQHNFAVWKQICEWERVKLCQVFLMTGCVWLHFITVNLEPQNHYDWERPLRWPSPTLNQPCQVHH